MCVFLRGLLLFIFLKCRIVFQCFIYTSSKILISFVQVKKQKNHMTADNFICIVHDEVFGVFFFNYIVHFFLNFLLFSSSYLTQSLHTICCFLSLSLSLSLYLCQSLSPSPPPTTPHFLSSLSMFSSPVFPLPSGMIFIIVLNSNNRNTLTSFKQKFYNPSDRHEHLNTAKSP